MVNKHLTATLGLSLLFMGVLGNKLDGQAPSEVPSSDNSDWWSMTRTAEAVEAGKIQHREIADTNLRIAGVDLRNQTFAEVHKELGQTPVVLRGDGSTHREQACYVSSQSGHLTYLVFEQGEVNSSFYLFSDSGPWNGRSLCARSKRIPEIVETASGLHLGQTPDQVLGILGQPSERGQGQLLYLIEMKKKTTPEALTRARMQHPELTEQQFHADYDTYDLTVLVCAKFDDSGLIYLGVSTAETS